MGLEVAFTVGDWVNEGEDKFGEMASQLTDTFSYWQVATWASVARRVPPENRLLSQDKITFRHHRAVAGLPPGEQRQALEDAAARGESAAALNARLRPPEPPVPGVPTYTVAVLRENLAGYTNTPFRNNGRAFAEAWLETL